MYSRAVKVDGERTESKALDQMTKAELMELARDRGVSAAGSKADLISRLGG